MAAPRVLDSATLDAVANDPSVLPGLAPGYDAVSLAAFFDRPGNLAFGDRDGAVLLGNRGDGVYEIHYLLTERRRGKAAAELIAEAVATLFTEHDATAICGETPREYRAARMMNRAHGGRPVGVSTDSHGRPCITYMLDRATWAISLAASLEASAP